MKITDQDNTSGIINTSANQETEKTKTSKNKTAIFAGDINLTEDPIAQKRKEAQKQAWKVVSDAWENDKKIDESVQERLDHMEKMRAQQKEATGELGRITEETAALKDQYQVTDDSQEQKDLELLIKRDDIKQGSHEILTEEEEARLAEIDEQGVTEYQQRALELNDQTYKWKDDLEEAEAGIRDDAGDIRAISLERLKTHGMVDAQKNADAIMAAASDEIKSMLVQDAVDNIDEKQEEQEEKAEEKKEESEENEERLEELQEKRAIQEAMIEKTEESVEKAKAQQKKNDAPDIDMDEMLQITQGNSQSPDVQKSLNDIKSSMKLLEADLKGIQVDEDV